VVVGWGGVGRVGGGGGGGVGGGGGGGVVGERQDFRKRGVADLYLGG